MNNHPYEPQTIQELLARRARHIHHLLMNLPATSIGNPGYDHFLQSVAAYQQARTAHDYAAVVVRCINIIETPSVSHDIRACYTWLAWVARWQVDTIMTRQ